MFSDILVDLAFRIIQVFLKVGQIVFLDTCINRCVQLQILIVCVNHILVAFRFFCGFIFPDILWIRSHQGRHVKTGSCNRDWIAGQRILLDLINIIVHAGRKRKDQRNANDTDCPGESGKNGPSFFGP